LILQLILPHHPSSSKQNFIKIFSSEFPISFSGSLFGKSVIIKNAFFNKKIRFVKNQLVFCERILNFGDYKINQDQKGYLTTPLNIFRIIKPTAAAIILSAKREVFQKSSSSKNLENSTFYH